METGKQLARRLVGVPDRIRTDLLPPGWRMVITGQTPEGGMPGAHVDWANKVIRLHNSRSALRADIVNHDIGHVLLEFLPSGERRWPRLPNARYTAFADAYMAARGLANEIRETGYLQEYAADDLARFFNAPETLAPKLRGVFAKYFPEYSVS